MTEREGCCRKSPFSIMPDRKFYNHYVARTYIGNAITNIQNGADLNSELQTAQDQVSFEMGL